MVFLVLLGNSWISSKKPRITELFWIPSKKPRITRVFGFPAKNQENLEKTKNPRIQDFQVDVWSTTKSWILGFLEVFLVFLVLLGNSWISSKKPRITRGFLDFQQKTKIY